MKKVHFVSALLMIALGFVHVGFTPVFYRRFDVGAMWFVGAGLATALFGAVNLLTAGRTDRLAVWLGRLVNLVGLVFVTTLAGLMKAPQAFLAVALMLGLLVGGERRR